MLSPEIDLFVRRRVKGVCEDGGPEVQRQPTGAGDELRKPMLLNDDLEIAALLGFFSFTATREGIAKGV
eukprot:7268203-Pyramimonas_sp.AAC.1